MLHNSVRGFRFGYSLNYFQKYYTSNIPLRATTSNEKSISTNISYSMRKPTGYWESKENINTFLNELKIKLNINTMEDWSSIKKTQINEFGGGTLLQKYSMYDIKCFGYPEGKFIFSKPNKKPKFWKQEKNIEKFLNDLKIKFNVNNSNDWNKITQKHIYLMGGGSLLQKYSMYDLKCMGCDEKDKILTKSKLLKEKNRERINKSIENLSKQLQLNNVNDWNSLTVKQIKETGEISLLKRFSIYDIKCMGYPEGKDFFSKPKKSIGYWEDLDNLKSFFATLKENLNIKTINDWNLLTKKQIKENGGGSLLQKYSIYEIKCLACPEGKDLFSNPYKSPGFWEKKKNIQEFIVKLKLHFNLDSIEKWNLLNFDQIKSIGGSSLFKSYSIYEIKCIGCPEGKFIFSSQPNPYKSHGFWDNDENIHNFLLFCKEKLKLNSIEDWNRVSNDQIRLLGGVGLLSKFSRNEILQFVKNISNDQSLHLSKASSLLSRSSQRWLFLQVQKIFPQEEIVEDYFHSEISRNSSFHVQFDIFLVNLNIAIEYHGRQHYEDIPNAGFASLEMYQNRDEEKAKLCKEYGIKLIVIPYWWDCNVDSLKNTIQEKLKDKN